MPRIPKIVSSPWKENSYQLNLLSYISILKWLPKYSTEDVIADIIAGLTIGLTMMPQSMAYAGLAGLTPQYGLYSSFMGSFVYVIFGTIKEVSVGPTSLMSLLSVEYTRDLPVEFMILLCFLSGCVELCMGIFQLGFLVDFISLPTVSGFQSATSVIIIISQIKNLLGLRFKSGDVVTNVKNVFLNWKKIKPYDTAIGLSCIIFLLALKKFNDLKIDKTKIKLKKFLWLTSISRNALAVLICATTAYVFSLNDLTPFTLTGEVAKGLPDFKSPPFQVTHHNQTYTFVEMCEKLGSGIIVVPVVSVLANVAIAKAFACGNIVDSTQEMVTLGFCNIAGSFVQSMPTCGAFTRSAVSNASGVRTPLAGLYSGTLILLALTFLTTYFRFIPKPTLSAILIAAVLFMVDYQILIKLWKLNKLDFFTAFATFIVSLIYGVELGLLFGVVLNVVNLLRLWARPSISVTVNQTESGIKYVQITPSIGLFFPAVDYLRNEIMKIASYQEYANLMIVIDCRSIFATDYTAEKGIEAIIKEFEVLNHKLVFINLKPAIRKKLLKMTVLRYVSTESRLDQEGYEESAVFPLLNGKEMEEGIRIENQKLEIILINKLNNSN